MSHVSCLFIYVQYITYITHHVTSYLTTVNKCNIITKIHRITYNNNDHNNYNDVK